MIPLQGRDQKGERWGGVCVKSGELHNIRWNGQRGVDRRKVGDILILDGGKIQEITAISRAHMERETRVGY